MKTYFSDLIPKLQKFSQKLDNLTLLTNQHWVVIDDIKSSKNVYIFRGNNELLISQNGKVEKAKWEYLGNNSLLIDRKDESYLFKHGFFDENILALKVDSKEEYAFLINENNYIGEINSIERVIDFLTKKYIEPKLKQEIKETTGIIIETQIKTKLFLVPYETDKGTIEIEQTHNSYIDINYERKVLLNGQLAPDGKYKLGFMWYICVKNGLVTNINFF